MSYVTNVVIQIKDYEKCNAAILKLNKYLEEISPMSDPFVPIESCAGTKCLEVAVLLGAFNYLNHNAFIEFFKALDLEDSLLTLWDQEGHITIVGNKVNE